tara:strand:- start:2542 stop:3114 length:573 start_codon:yes stop_codon:yes gene_type:complete
LPKTSINIRCYLYYKLYNSLFLGIGIGSYISQYQPIKILEIAILGIIFALLSIIIAKQYQKIININYFFKISLFVEYIMLFWMLAFLIFTFSYKIALLIYICRSITFLFGDYLGRAETHILKNKKIFTFIDINRQKGLILGMIYAVIFYYIVEHFFNISDNQKLVYYIHYILLFLQIYIIFQLNKSFKKG